MAAEALKPAVWAFDPAAVDPNWYDNFWGKAISVLPLWEAGQARGVGDLATGKNYAFTFTQTWVSETWGPALFSNNNGNVAVSPVYNFDFPNNDFTLFYYGRISSSQVGGTQKLFSNDNGFSVAFQVNGTVAIQVLDSTPAWVSTGISVMDDKLHLWALERQGTTVRLYLDGLLKATITIAGIGTSSSQQRWFSGNDDANYWNVANTAFVGILQGTPGAGFHQAWAADPFGPFRMADVSGVFAPTPAGGNTTVVISKSSLVLSGKTVFGNELAVLSKSSLTLTTKTTFGNVTSQVLKSALTLSPQTVFGNETAIVSKSNLTLSGKLVSFLANTVIIVSKAALTLTGKLVSASVSGTVALYRRGRQRRRLLLK